MALKFKSPKLCYSRACTTSSNFPFSSVFSWKTCHFFGFSRFSFDICLPKKKVLSVDIRAVKNCLLSLMKGFVHKLCNSHDTTNSE